MNNTTKTLLDDLQIGDWSEKVYEELKDGYLQGKVTYEEWVEYWNQREISGEAVNLKKLTWKEIKTNLKIKLGDGEIYYEKDLDWNFVISNNDRIRGKPQLIDAIKKNIIIGRETISKKKIETGEGKKEDVEIRKIVMFDEKFDKRYSGPVISSFCYRFFLYRVIENNGNEHYILSENYLPNEVCDFKGMSVDVEDFAEISKSMRIGCLTSVFFLDEYKSSVSILPPSDIVSFTKSREITEEDWFKFLAYHKDFNSFNRFPKITELLKSAHLLSSKVDGWPLHIGVIGPQGTRKSKGYIETIANKLEESPDIVEGANSRIKGLTPSFKEKPANLGYLANCNRMGWVDELGKMVEIEIGKHTGNNWNVLGEANFLLEHSIRQVSSGNDNTAVVGATAKFTFVMNPISKKKTIYEHIGPIDATTMSRILWWVQSKEEQDFSMGKEGIVRIKENSPLHTHNPPNTISRNFDFIHKNHSWAWLSVGGKLENRAEFLTLYDSCNSFRCNMCDEKVEELVNYSVLLAKEPMKSVWKPRAEHHVRLLLDGVCKHRCLFVDYDDCFTAIDIDYETTKAILNKMIDSWDTRF